MGTVELATFLCLMKPTSNYKTFYCLFSRKWQGNNKRMESNGALVRSSKDLENKSTMKRVSIIGAMLIKSQSSAQH